MMRFLQRQENQSLFSSPFEDAEKSRNALEDIFSFRRPLLARRDFSHLFNVGIYKMSVREEKNKILVDATIPGLEKDDVKVFVRDNVLVIEGEKKRDKEIKEKGIVRRGSFYGAFHRNILLPSHVDLSTLKSSVQDGVLHISVLKKQGTHSKRG